MLFYHKKSIYFRMVYFLQDLQPAQYQFLSIFYATLTNPPAVVRTTAGGRFMLRIFNYCTKSSTPGPSGILKNIQTNRVKVMTIKNAALYGIP